MKENMEKTAFVAIVGKPNVGKSSLLNVLIGKKIAIVSRKPQTTRTRIIGVWTEGENQIVFMDTPGLHKPQNRLGNYMVKAVNQSVSGVDACLLVVEAGQHPSPADRELIKKFKSLDIPAVLAINKVDLLKEKELLMGQITEYTALHDFQAVVPVSAIDGNGIAALREELKKLCEEGTHFFEEDALTDQPDRTIAGEMVREKLLRLLDKEIPHGTAVAVERFQERQKERENILDIEAVIVCERDNHKGIIIGKGGAMLKKIGTLARIDMEKFFGCKVNLKLWVKVKEDWRNRDSLLSSFGYDSRYLDS